ncbi:hypothetical protein CDD83_6138 [Cordyceps sp. RAO-2017]|nr:hypothetical protein CDD83_6138 [Cordyceps sp. RAO-2017]
MTSEAAGSMTPPPPSSIQTPPAPRLGFHDGWEPYPPRKSARISSQRAANRTPSPRASHSRKQLATPRTSKRVNSQSSAAMASPVLSPRKKLRPAASSSRQPSGTLTAEGTANAAAALGLHDTKAAHQKAPAASVSRAAGMLPTPVKTPQKPPSEKTAANIQTFARNLFASDEEAMPSPRKRRPKKYSGVTMESFTAEEEGGAIEIFTDSQDRVPTKDQSAENPFYGDKAVAEPSKRRSKRRLVNVPGEGALSVEEASRREDGMVYVFRGKRLFREFSKNDSAQPEEQDASRADTASSPTRPLTRSSVKPRLLFPRNKADKANDDDAATDIEDARTAEEPAHPQTPRKRSPLVHESTPLKSSPGRRSPFDAWPRTKEIRSPSGSKRHGDSLSSAATKRTRA